jgi:hypothetical protein
MTAQIDLKKLNASLAEIIDDRNKLSKLTYDSKDYDKIEEELHDLEDDFTDAYGDYLEAALEKVHDQICPDSDVLLPIAYLALNYKIVGKNPDGTTAYDVENKEGIWVDADKFPGKDTRLVIVPNPLRILFVVDGQKKVVWEAEK